MSAPIKTSKMSNKFWLCLIFAINGIAHADCSIEERDGGKTLYMRQGNKSIAILGWQHPTETETLRTNMGTANVIKSTATKCKDLTKIVTEILDQQKGLNDSTADLTKRLTEVPFLKNSTLGMEISELGWKNIQSSNAQTLSLETSIKIYDVFTTLAKGCPDQKENLLLFMRETILPVNAVAIDLKREQQIELKTKGMDDFKLRDEYFRNTTQQSRNFKFTEQPYTQETKEKLNPIVAKAQKSLETPSEDSIKEVTETIQDPILKGKTLDALRTLQIKTRTDRARTTKIMENIMSTSGNVIMAVGEEHLSSLKSEFQKFCKPNTRTDADSTTDDQTYR